MRIGIIGFGSIGNRHYQNLQKYSIDFVILSKRSDLPNIDTVSTWEEMKSRGEFDAFFITNETSKHLDTIDKCIELKPKAIFIEKPISHDCVNLKEIKEKLEKNNISVWVGYNFHFFAPFLRIKEILRKKSLGDIYHLRVSVGQDLKEWRPRDYQLCYSSKKKGGGGVMLDLVHDINYPAWLLDQKLDPLVCTMDKLSDLEIDTEDCVDSILKAKNGTIVIVHQDYIRIPYKRSLDICGNEASLNWNSQTNNITVKNNQGVILEEKIEEDRNEMYIREADYFINKIKQGEYFSNLDEAIYDVELIEKLKNYAKQKI